MTGAKKARFAFIDQYRGWAVIIMIETHVLNTFLRHNLRDTSWFKVVDFFNGLVAPSFLFLAGFSFAIVAGRKWDEFLRLKPAFWKQLRRYAFILTIGYFLHLPGFSLRVLLRQLRWNENSLFWGVDILHCIAAALFFMLLLVPLLRRRHILFPLLAAAAVAVSFLTMAVYARPIQEIVAAPFAGYLKRILWSQFPLFPWMGYVLFGAFFSYLWQAARQKERDKLFFSYIMAVAGSLVFILTLTLFHPQMLIQGISFSPAFPRFFFIKLGLVLMLLSFFRWLESIKQDRPRLATLVGRESLLAYAFHIMFIFSAIWPWGQHSLSLIIGPTRPPLQVAALALALIGLTIAVCLAWRSLKEKKPLLSRRLFICFWALVLLLFSIF